MSYEIPQPEQPGHSVLAALFEYNAWATMKLLDFCEKLSEEQLNSATVGGYGHIRLTLQHMIVAEVNYVSRIVNQLPENPPSHEAFSSFEDLRAAVKWANERLLQLSLATKSDTLVVETFPEETVKYPQAAMMAQAPTHAMEHRTHIAAIITSLGLEPPAMDTWAWVEERKGFQVIPTQQN